MTKRRPDIRAVVPVQEIACARQRLAGVLSAALRQELALAMLEDVLDAVSQVCELAGFAIVPARDKPGSNAVLCGPGNIVTLRFGDDSFLPHLAAPQRASA